MRLYRASNISTYVIDTQDTSCFFNSLYFQGCLIYSITVDGDSFSSSSYWLFPQQLLLFADMLQLFHLSLSLRFCLCLCLSLSLSVCASVSVYVCLSVSVCLSLSLSVCLSVSVSIALSLSLLSEPRRSWVCSCFRGFTRISWVLSDQTCLICFVTHVDCNCSARLLPVRRTAVRAASKFLHTVLSLTSVSMVPWLWPRSLSPASTRLCHVVWDRPRLFPSGVQRIAVLLMKSLFFRSTHGRSSSSASRWLRCACLPGCSGRGGPCWWGFLARRFCGFFLDWQYGT